MNFDIKKALEVEVSAAVMFLKYHTKEVNGQDVFNLKIHGGELGNDYPQDIIEKRITQPTMNEAEINTYKNLFDGVLSGK